MATAIFGSGTIADVHLNALRFIGKEVSIVINKFPESGNSFAKKWGIKKFSTNPMDAMGDDIDTVHICTPPNLHYETAKLALENNKNVICEKPFCLSSSQAIELYNLAKNKNLVNAVNFNVRYNPACMDAKNYVKDKLGEVLLIHGSYLQEFHVLPTQYSWRYKPEFGGNMRAVTEIASHWIDLARYISGLEVTEVSANFAYFNKNRLLKDNIMYPANEGEGNLIVNSEDTAAILLRFSNGAIGNLIVSEHSHGRNNKVAIEFTGKNSSIWWDSEDPHKLHTAGKNTGINTNINVFSGGYKESFVSFFKAVYDSIDKKQNEYPSFYDGVINVVICNAIYKSANNNSQWVKIEF